MQQSLNVINERMSYKKLDAVHKKEGLDRFEKFISNTLSTTGSSPSLWWERIRASQCMKSVRRDIAEDVTLNERKVKSEKVYFARVSKNTNMYAYKTIILCLTEPTTELVDFPECIKALKPCDAYVVFEDCDVLSKTYINALNSRPTGWLDSMYREFVLAFK
jgi:hypothetical protein